MTGSAAGITRDLQVLASHELTSALDLQAVRYLTLGRYGGLHRKLSLMSR